MTEVGDTASQEVDSLYRSIKQDRNTALHAQRSGKRARAGTDPLRTHYLPQWRKSLQPKPAPPQDPVRYPTRCTSAGHQALVNSCRPAETPCGSLDPKEENLTNLEQFRSILLLSMGVTIFLLMIRTSSR